MGVDKAPLPSLGGEDRPSSVGNNPPSVKDDPLLSWKKVNASVAYGQGPQWTGAALVPRVSEEGDKEKAVFLTFSDPS